jgi:hypothetical protein
VAYPGVRCGASDHRLQDAADESRRTKCQRWLISIDT